MTGVVVGFWILARSQGNRVESLGFWLSFSFSASLGFSADFSADFSPSIVVVPAASLVLYPNKESPSTELLRVKFGIVLAGLGVRDASASLYRL
jgi:hypothetical protein